MPRLPPRLLHEAAAIHRLLPLLLRPCRELPSARNELRWLTEHVERVTPVALNDRRAFVARDAALGRLCRQRGRGVPLQYLLGTEYFGDLELLCRPGVLIPRPETATMVSHLSARLAAAGLRAHFAPVLRVLDLCTGSGCVPLLLVHHLRAAARAADVRLHVRGVDVAPRALALARANRARVRAAAPDPRAWDGVRFGRADVLRDEVPGMDGDGWDVVVANPPYVSRRDFDRVVERSVRRFEPRLALVPEARGRPGENPEFWEGGAGVGPRALEGLEAEDVFYPRIARVAERAGARVVLVEVGDIRQAVRVAGMWKATGRWKTVEIWRDEIGVAEEAVDEKAGVVVRGRGDGRAVFCSMW